MLYGPRSRRVTDRVYHVYILASRIGATLYIGITSNLVRRVYEHREKLVKGFTESYGGPGSYISRRMVTSAMPSCVRSR